MKGIKRLDGPRFLSYLGTALIYPVYALITSDGKLIKFIDAATIVGFVFVVLGVVNSLLRHGDFDIFEYVTRRSANSMRHQKTQSFSDFREAKEEKRRDRANEPLLTGILLLLVSAALVIFVY